MTSKNILITGTNSGLGSSLHRILGGVCFDRGQDIDTISKQEYDCIIHCAVDTNKEVDHRSIDTFFSNNVGLTRQLLNVPHRQFVYISSVDVYPKSFSDCHEEQKINAHDILGVYGLTKFYSEALVKENGTSHLILRPSALLGPNMRPNTLTRLLSKQVSKLGLSENSSFNFVRHEDIATIIESSWSESIQGILNVCSRSNISLGKIAKSFEREMEFGDFEYKIPRINTQQLRSLFPFLDRSSLETAKIFWRENSHSFTG